MRLLQEGNSLRWRLVLGVADAIAEVNLDRGNPKLLLELLRKLTFPKLSIYHGILTGMEDHPSTLNFESTANLLRFRSCFTLPFISCLTPVLALRLGALTSASTTGSGSTTAANGGVSSG